MLAVLPESGGSLPMYLLSWLQSNLIWSGSERITQAELEDKPTAHEHLNNYDLLSRARFDRTYASIFLPEMIHFSIFHTFFCLCF